MKLFFGLSIWMGVLSAQAIETAFFVGDEGNHRVALYNQQLELIWDYPVQKPYTVLLLDDGNLLATTGTSVIEITPDKQKVWSFNRGNNEIFGAARLNNITVIGDCTAGEILFVKADGTLQSSFKTTAEQSGGKRNHGHMRTLTVTPQQTILVAHLADHIVREYDLSGHILNEFKVRSSAYRGERLANGNTLVGHEHGVTEFTASGSILRDLKPEDIPSMGLAFGTHAHRMPNGHTVMANWFGHGGKGGKALFELDENMLPIWSIPNGTIGSTAAFLPVSNAVVKQYKKKDSPHPSPLMPSQPSTTESVRQAIANLTATFPERYPKCYQQLLEGEQLEKASSAQRNEALLANPLLQEVSLLYTARRQYQQDHHNTATLFQHGEINDQKFDPPGKLKILNLKTGTVHTLVDAGATGLARDPELSADGNRILFSMRKNKTDGYHIYEIQTDDSHLKQLTSCPDVSDIDPVYLPDGKIVFSSTREPKYCMCNRHIMANLYRMDGDGANLLQIGKSTLFEGHSTVMEDGRILYDRWEYTDRNFGDAQGLWMVNPDGTMHTIFYGNNTPSPGGVIDARQIPGSQNVIAIFGSCHDRPWGALAIINRNKGVDGAAPVEHIWPASARSLIGVGNWDTFKRVRPRYEDPYPLADPQTHAGAGTYFLCARTLQDDDERTGIYLIDTFGNEVLVHEEQDGFSCFDPMPLQAHNPKRRRPELRNYDNANGTFYIQNVYEGTHMEGVQRGEVKYLRVVETPEKRSWIASSWGGQGSQSPAMNWHSFESKRILGTVPVEDDGSAYFEIPSDTFFYFQLLNKNGQMIQSMRSGTIIQSGEMQGCVGCHESRVGTPPASATGLQALTRHPSQMGEGYGAGIPFNYLSEVQPIFDRHCVKCHDFGKKAGEKLNLAGDKGLVFNASYNELHRKNIIEVAGGGRAETYPAKSWGSLASTLTKALNGHKKTRLTAQEKERIYTWLDLNGVYYPTYNCAFPDNLTGRNPIPDPQLKRLAKLCHLDLKRMRSHAKNPGPQISFDRPPISPCLQDLKKGSAEYNEALAIIEAGAQTLKKVPRADMPGFTPSAPDLQRTQRYEAMQRKEAAFRNALKEGQKRYDTDETYDMKGVLPSKE